MWEVRGGYVRLRMVWFGPGELWGVVLGWDIGPNLTNITLLYKTPSNKRDNNVVMYSSTL